MNKRLVLTVMVTALLAASGMANADNGRRGHHGAHHGPHHYRGYNRHRGRPHYRARHHYRPAYHYGYHHGYRSGRHELRKGLKIAAGALLIGSVIHAATDHRRDRVVVRRRITPGYDGAGYHYRLDRDGQCYEVTTNDRGEEVWTYVERGYCE